MFVAKADSISGYQHADYAQSLAEFGKPLLLPRSKGWFLQRHIEGTPFLDGIGCYPLFSCQDWTQLDADLSEIGSDWVSAVMVADPCANYRLEDLQKAFPDLCTQFKDHYVIDLSKNPDEFVERHHRRNVRRGLKSVEVVRCTEPSQGFSEWVRLYDILKTRHQITGIAAFSDEAFRKQFQTPGLTAFMADYGDNTVGMLLWYIQGDGAYYHLGATDQVGYEMRAPFALFWHAIEYFQAIGLKWLDLGGVAGVTAADDGLRRFKSGWSTGQKSAYLCGRILDPEMYIQLCRTRENSREGFFPVYRAGEFE